VKVGIDFSTLVYMPNFDIWGRTVIFTPLVSQPNAAPYENRAIYDTDEVDVPADDGSVLTSHKTTLDIREAEFGILPTQGDRVFIPADVGAMEEVGNFEIINVWQNGGGETTLLLRKIETAG
jgi:hypothetical protein